MDDQILIGAGAFVLVTLLFLPLVAAIFNRSPDPEDEPAE